MAKQKIDVFPNRAIQRLTLSAADTLTFTQMRFGAGLFTGTALVIHRVDWYPDETSMNSLAQGSDQLLFAITNRDDIATLSADNMNCLVTKFINTAEAGTPATLNIIPIPLISDFTQLPGGGLIVPSNPLFLAGASTGLGAVMVLDMIMYYTQKELVDADYIELIQSLIPVNI